MADVMIDILQINVGNFNVADTLITFAFGVCVGAFPIGLIGFRKWNKMLYQKRVREIVDQRFESI